jgi:hypothetical protein
VSEADFIAAQNVSAQNRPADGSTRASVGSSRCRTPSRAGTSASRPISKPNQVRHCQRRSHWHEPHHSAFPLNHDDEFGRDATEIWRTAARVWERFDDADQALRAYRMALSCSGHPSRVPPAALESQRRPNAWACQHFLSVKQMPPDLSGTSLFRMPVAR